MLERARKAFKIIRNIGLIIKNDVRGRKSDRILILVAYFQLLLRAGNSVLGFKFNHFIHRDLLTSFEEFFIENIYYFRSDTKAPFIVDGGANLGEEILYFKWLYPQAEVIAFEPGKNAFRLLKKNISDNYLRKVVLHPFALSRNNRIENFYIEVGNPAAASMSLYKQRLNKGKTKVRTVCLSSYVNREIDFLKLDIEGEETAVISELSRKNKLRLVKQFVIEYHHHINTRVNNLSKILTIFEENGFGYQLSTPLNPPFEKEKYQDILIFGYRRNVMK